MNEELCDVKPPSFNIGDDQGLDFLGTSNEFTGV